MQDKKEEKKVDGATSEKPIKSTAEYNDKNNESSSDDNGPNENAEILRKLEKLGNAEKPNNDDTKSISPSENQSVVSGAAHSVVSGAGDAKSAKSSASSLGRSNYIQKMQIAFLVFSKKVQKLYLRFVSFRLETIFYLFLVLPYCLNVAIILNMPSMILSSMVEVVLVKGFVLLVGLVAIGLTNTLNKRHTEAYLIGEIFNGEGNVKKIITFHKHEGESKILKYLGKS